MGGDLNGHIGRKPRGYKVLHEGYGLREANTEEKVILYYSLTFTFTIAKRILVLGRGKGILSCTCSESLFLLIRLHGLQSHNLERA